MKQRIKATGILIAAQAGFIQDWAARLQRLASDIQSHPNSKSDPGELIDRIREERRYLAAIGIAETRDALEMAQAYITSLRDIQNREGAEL